MVWARPGAPQAEQKGKRMVPDQIREQKTQNKTKNAQLAMHMTTNTSCRSSSTTHTTHTHDVRMIEGCFFMCFCVCVLLIFRKHQKRPIHVVKIEGPVFPRFLEN